MASWQLQEAKAKLSEVIDTAEKHGAQVITRRGIEAAVVVPIEEWRRMQSGAKRTLLEILRSGPMGEISLPPRGKTRHRKPVVF